MRVLRILTRANLGGPARQLQVLAPEFARLGVDERIAVGSLGAEESSVDLGDSVRTLTLPSMRRGFAPLDDRAALRGLLEIVRSEAIDVVHTHTAKAGLLGVRLARAAGLPVVHSYHGHVLRDYFGVLLSRIFTGLERRMAQSRAAITCVSESCADELAELGVFARARCRVVLPALPPLEKLTGPALREARDELDLASDGEALRVAWCGRIERVKDPLLLAAVLHRFASLGAKAMQLRIFGSGSLESALRRALRGLPASIDVRFVGPDPRFRERIGAFDVLLATSIREGLPLTGVEALLSECAVVAPDVPGFRDLEGPGVLLAARCADALAAALLRAPRAASARAADLRRAHDPAVIARQYYEVYERVCVRA